ncbi:XAC2610-related protein [Lysobacter sp. CA199]|uniref:XAC2610-related protein n=1 Tax=Lysobacter sp. CA199 TaxID=3455608 RepID=UPI003F8D3C53
MAACNGTAYSSSASTASDTPVKPVSTQAAPASDGASGAAATAPTATAELKSAQGSRKYRGCLTAAGGDTQARGRCLDEELAYQDRALNTVYKEKIGAVSGAQRDALRTRQRDWLNETDRLCGVAGKTAPAVPQDGRECRLARTIAQFDVLAASGSDSRAGRQSAHGFPDAHGALSLRLGDAVVAMQAQRCAGQGRRVCSGAQLRIVLPGVGEQTLSLPQVAFSTVHKAGATGYRGSLDVGFVDGWPTFMLSDINGDGKQDLIVWTGFEGSYGDPSYGYYLFDPKSGRWVENRALADLVDGHSVSRIAAGRLDIWYRSGPCERGEKTIELRGDTPRIAEQNDYDTCTKQAP